MAATDAVDAGCLLVSANACRQMPGTTQRPCQRHRMGIIVQRRIKPSIVLSDTANAFAASASASAAGAKPNQDEFG